MMMMMMIYLLLLRIKMLSMNNTENLNCLIHLHFPCASLSKVYYIIKSLKDVMSFQMIRTIYYA